MWKKSFSKGWKAGIRAASIELTRAPRACKYAASYWKMGGPIPHSIAAFLAALAVLFGSGVAALFCRRSTARAAALGAGGAAAGGALGLFAALHALFGTSAPEWAAPWPLAIGSVHLGLDPLSALFLIPVFALTALAAVYAVGYWRNSPPARAAGGWFFFNLLTAGMALVLAARDAVLFLAAWELMTIASFRLVAFEPERPGAVRAALMYLAASQASAACLFAMFLRLGAASGGTDFAGFADFAARSPDVVSFALALGLLGFGLKAGLMPLHGWLPLAHPAAPSPVSAVMSGVMIKTGIYGLARLTMLAGRPPLAWGWALLAIGIVSGILGVLFALRQHDLKRLLAFHSVENIGIIALGLGLGVVGAAKGLPAVALLGWTGALFHVVNHAMFKGLLFLGAGAAMQGAGSGALDRLGGLLRRMPATGWTFLIGAAAISGLPPFNGFASEFLIYAGGFRSLLGPSRALAAGGVASLAALALMGGLAAACFAKVFGIVFLGEPRTPAAAAATDVGGAQRGPMVALAALCLLLGLGAPFAARPAALAAAAMAGERAPPSPGAVPAGRELEAVALGGLALVALSTALFALSRGLRAGRSVRTGPTWDCGYLRPSARMQYTAASFAQPLLDAFHLGPLARREATPPRAFLAEPTERDAHRVSTLRTRWSAALATAGRQLDALRWMQHGNVHLYALYIALTLLALLLGVFR